MPIFWFIPKEAAWLRQAFLITTSFLFVFALAPWSALQIAWMTCVAALSLRVFNFKKNVWILWAMILLSCLPLLWHRVVDVNATILITIGVTFATLRAVSVVIDGYSGASNPSARTVFTYMFFLPLYTVGPVDKANKFSEDGLGKSIELEYLVRGFSRLCLGLFKSAVIADQLIKSTMVELYPQSTRSFEAFGAGDALLFIALSFAYTYVNFSAFVDIAIGVSKMFGVRVIENFNFPIFARNLQDFWKRWHISLGNWITNYLYMPIVFMIGKRWAPYVATFVAFSLIGWWHDSSFNYILWGVLHGIGLCVNQYFMKKKGRKGQSTPLSFAAICSWAATLFYVAWVQTIANMKTAEDAWLITRALFQFS